MRPPYLKSGQTAGIVSPSRTVDSSLLMKGVEVIESWGLKVKLGKHSLLGKQTYLAAPDADRLKDVQQMLDDPTINLIFSSRGGYGTTRIVDQLDFRKFLVNPKWIVGFSDITALHLKLARLGVESIHGCMPAQFSKEEYKSSVGYFQELLFGTNNQIPLEANHSSYNRNGLASGRVIGGNLSLLTDAIGTSSEPDTKGALLVLEEIDEYLYKVDRMLVQLKRSGKLKDLAGLVVGHMTDMKDTELPFGASIEELILDKVKEYEYPVAFQFPIGHQAPNMPWRHNAQATLDVTSDKSSLLFL